MLALVNAKIYTISNGVIENGSVLIQGGKISEVGAGIDIPSDAEVFDCKGKTVMPGMVDPSTCLGIHEDGWGSIGWDEDEATSPATPGVRVLDAINPEDWALQEALAAGVTTVMVSPGVRNVIGGEMAVIKTFGNTVDEMVIRQRAGVKINLSSGRARSEAAAIFLRELQKARNALNAGAEEEIDDINTAVLIDLLKGNCPAYFQGVKVHDILNAIEIAEEWGLDYVIERCLEGHLVVAELKAAQPKLVVGPIMVNRRGDTRPVSHKTPGILADAGLDIALTTNHPKVPAEHALVQAALAFREGMSEETALRAVTLRPAQILGVADRVGSIEPGKDADLVIMTGHPFDVFTLVEAVFVNGEVAFRAERSCVRC